MKYLLDILQKCLPLITSKVVRYSKRMFTTASETSLASGGLHFVGETKFIVSIFFISGI